MRGMRVGGKIKVRQRPTIIVPTIPAPRNSAIVITVPRQDCQRYPVDTTLTIRSPLRTIAGSASTPLSKSSAKNKNNAHTTVTTYVAQFRSFWNCNKNDFGNVPETVEFT